MLTITRTAPNRLEIAFSGELDADTMRAALDDLIAKSADIQHGTMLYRIQDFSFPTVGALAVELARLPKLFALIGKFDRCAVLCETPWVRKVAEIEGALFPGLDIKSFEPDQGAQAEAWLAQVAHD